MKIELSKINKKEEKKSEHKMNRAAVLWDNFKRPNVCVLKVSKKKARET